MEHMKYTKICTIWKFPAIQYVIIQYVLQDMESHTASVTLDNQLRPISHNNSCKVCSRWPICHQHFMEHNICFFFFSWHCFHSELLLSVQYFSPFMQDCKLIINYNSNVNKLESTWKCKMYRLLSPTLKLSCIIKGWRSWSDSIFISDVVSCIVLYRLDPLQT